MDKRYLAPGARAKRWNRIATIALLVGALVTAWLVYLAFTRVS